MNRFYSLKERIFPDVSFDERATLFRGAEWAKGDFVFTRLAGRGVCGRMTPPVAISNFSALIPLLTPVISHRGSLKNSLLVWRGRVRGAGAYGAFPARDAGLENDTWLLNAKPVSGIHFKENERDLCPRLGNGH